MTDWIVAPGWEGAVEPPLDPPELKPQPMPAKGAKKGPKGPKREQVWIYLCSSELQRMQCSVLEVSPTTCRVGCPYFQKRKPGQEAKRERLTKLKARLVDFGKARAEIIAFWEKKERDFKAEGLRNDAYIMYHICEIIAEVNPKVAFTKLTLSIRRCQSPLFRDYYKKAREDISRLRKIQLDHERVRKEQEKEEMRDAVRRELLTRKEADGVLPAQSGTQEGVSGTVEGVPEQEVISD